MKDGKMLKVGTPDEVITDEIINKTYGIKLEVEEIKDKRFVLTV